ncbi:MAG TPA: type IV toxin-antitoxin system AbiEi family antitoxin domain-containing protein [Kofleriaceae bacterium]
MGVGTSHHPDWDRLYEAAAGQEGLFTTQQAADAGYSPQLLIHHLHAGKVVRVQRGIYRIVHFPSGEHEDLIAIWLWSEQAGVFSHQTALALHGLSDVLPAQLHLTLPSAWRRRRFRVPPGVVLHYADVSSDERAWFGAAPATNPPRTLNDVARDGLTPELLRQAAQQALRRGLVTRRQIRAVEDALKPFGGLRAQ